MASEMNSTPINATSADPSKGSPSLGATRWAWLLLPGGVYLAALFIAPLLILLLLSLGMPTWTLENFRRIADNSVYFSILRTTLEISISVTVLAFLLGYPIAYMLATGRARIRTFLLIAVVLPYFTSVLARTFSWIVLLGRGGIVNEILLQIGAISQPITMLYNRTGVIIGMTHVIMPLMILPMSTVMASIDTRLLRAARANGASPMAAFLTIFLPLSLPGVIAGVLLVFIYCLGFYITPALLGGISDLMITMEISSQVVEQLNWNFGSALAMVLLIVVLFILWVGSRFFPIDQLLGFSSETASSSSARRQVGGRWLMSIGAKANSLDKWLPSFGGQGVAVVACLTGVLLLLPVMIVVYLSFSSSNYFEFPAPGYALRNYQAYLSDPLWINATFTSVRVALISTTLATLLGGMLAFGLSRGRIPGRGAAVALVLSPIIVPTVVVAVATYFLLAKVGLQGTEIGLALGHAVHSIPFVVVIVVANLRDLNPAFERAARSLGAGPFATFRTITGPLIMPALIVAAFFAFLTSFDDVVYVLFLGIGKITTLPMRMWEGIKQDVSPTISAVATLQIALAAAVIIISHFLRRRHTN
jgi:putative spermidine/putrescine transport system permease protein